MKRQTNNNKKKDFNNQREKMNFFFTKLQFTIVFTVFDNKIMNTMLCIS